ncbi:hypothetical protein CspHIS471_0607330 [Cutaneotrichosporon sp. HIS471]|nr:hypothetical protein CspHIS471_0607330 [Cutaneotrichosporon sp. HIS471]
MYATVFTSLLMAVAVWAQDGPRIETPASVVQCQPARLMWSGGSPPYWITVIPAGQAGAAPIMTLKDSTTDTSMTWNVNLAPTTQVTLQIRDGAGNVQFSSPITIQAGSDTACMSAAATGTNSAGAEAGASGAPTNSGSAPAASGSTPAAGGSASGSAPAASASTPAASASAPAPSPSSAAKPTSSAAAPSGSASASHSGSAAASASSAPAAKPSSGASAANVPIIGAAAVAAAIMAYPTEQHIPPHYLNLSISLSSPTYEAPRTTPIPAPKAHYLFASNTYLHPRHLQTICNNIKIVAHQLRIPSLWHESYRARARARTRPSIASSRFPTVLDPSLHLGASHSTSASFLTPFLDKRGRPRGASLFSFST